MFNIQIQFFQFLFIMVELIQLGFEFLSFDVEVRTEGPLAVFRLDFCEDVACQVQKIAKIRNLNMALFEELGLLGGVVSIARVI